MEINTYFMDKKTSSDNGPLVSRMQVNLEFKIEVNDFMSDFIIIILYELFILLP